jgi:hypothetical protein
MCNETVREQLLKLAYEKRSEIYAMSDDPDEFDCLIHLIEDGDISTFEELAEYGVKR